MSDAVTVAAAAAALAEAEARKSALLAQQDREQEIKNAAKLELAAAAKAMAEAATAGSIADMHQLMARQATAVTKMSEAEKAVAETVLAVERADTDIESARAAVFRAEQAAAAAAAAEQEAAAAAAAEEERAREARCAEATAVNGRVASLQALVGELVGRHGKLPLLNVKPGPCPCGEKHSLAGCATQEIQKAREMIAAAVGANGITDILKDFVDDADKFDAELKHMVARGGGGDDDGIEGAKACEWCLDVFASKNSQHGRYMNNCPARLVLTVLALHLLGHDVSRFYDASGVGAKRTRSAAAAAANDNDSSMTAVEQALRLATCQITNMSTAYKQMAESLGAAHTRIDELENEMRNMRRRLDDEQRSSSVVAAPVPPNMPVTRRTLSDIMEAMTTVPAVSVKELVLGHGGAGADDDDELFAVFQ